MQRKFNRRCDLFDYFRKNFGNVKSKTFLKAQKNFADSLAGYSLVCYILQIKDRHNANILLNKDGCIVHIDFGYMLTTAPGRGIQIETVPFKLTNEFVRVLGGGPHSPIFRRFQEQMVLGLKQLNKEAAKIILLAQMVANS